MSRRITTRKKTVTLDPSDYSVRRRITNSIKSPPSTNFLSFLFPDSASLPDEEVGPLHKCLICFKDLTPVPNCASRPGPKSKKPKLSPQSTTLERDKVATMLHFISVDCLGQDVTEDEVKTSFAEGRDYLCTDHIKLVEKALEIDKLIRNMIQELDVIKETVRREVEIKLKSSSSNYNGEIHEVSMQIKCEDELDVDPSLFLEVQGENNQETEKDNIPIKYPARQRSKKRRSRKRFVKRKSSRRLPHLPSRQLDPEPETANISSLIDNEQIVEKATTTGLEVGVKFENELHVKTEPAELNDDDLDYSVPSPLDSDWAEFNKDPTQSSDSDSNFGNIKSRKLRPRKKATNNLVLADGQTNEDTERPAGKSKSIKTVRAKRRNKPVRNKPKRIAPAKRRFFCHLCHNSFPAKKECKAHILDVHGHGPQFHCDQCSRRYHYIYDLKKHKIRSHGEPDKSPFSCEDCQKIFPTWADLKDHKQMEHSTIEILDCPYCSEATGKKYKGHKNLETHIRNFHQGRPALPAKHLVCEFCGQAFSNATDFKKHRNKVHLKTYEKTPCDICGRLMSDVKSLRKHKLSQHNKSYQYKCPLCGSESLFKSHLIAHLKNSHTSLPPEERDDLVKNCKKIVDNTNPIYWQKQIQKEPSDNNGNPQEQQMNNDSLSESDKSNSNEKSDNHSSGQVVPAPQVNNEHQDVFSEFMNPVKL